jgi:hypothetical protein
MKTQLEDVIVRNDIPWIHGQTTEPAETDDGDTDEKPNDSWTIFED